MKCDESGTGRDESAAGGTNRADSGTNQRRSCCHAAHKGGPLDVVQDYRRLLDRKDIADKGLRRERELLAAEAATAEPAAS